MLRRSLVLLVTSLLLTGCATWPAHCSTTGFEAPPLLDPGAAVVVIAVDACEGIVRAHRALTAPARPADEAPAPSH
jgi:uncharacterized lipoprotein YajG